MEEFLHTDAAGQGSAPGAAIETDRQTGSQGPSCSSPHLMA